MISSLCNSSAFAAFICAALLSCCNEHVVEGVDDLCEGPSITHPGACFGDCEIICKKYEGAIGGRCQAAKCFCTRKCQENPLCPKPSARFHGPCADSDACFNLCTGGEGDVGGMCSIFKCICVRKC